MIDDILFLRGHIETRIGDERDDFDIVIPEHYFFNVLGLEGEVIDSNGSEYELVTLDGDNFEIVFTVDENEFETEDGSIVSFNELVVHCTGVIVSDDTFGDYGPKDVLQIATYDVVRVM